MKKIKTNCPNCGAPIDPYRTKCQYCGTIYFDFAAFNLEDDTPCYIKFKTPQGIITTLARPELGTCDLTYETVDVCGPYNMKIMSYITNNICDFNITFHACIDKETNSLFTYQVK